MAMNAVIRLDMGAEKDEAGYHPRDTIEQIVTLHDRRPLTLWYELEGLGGLDCWWMREIW